MKTRMLRVCQMLALAALCGGCLTGCRMSALKLAGYTEPKMLCERTWFGWRCEVSSEFTGEAHAEYDPNTGAMKIDAKIASSVVPVYAAQGERARDLVELRRDEATYLLESQRLVGQNIQAFGTMLAIAAQGGADAVATVANAAAPLLATGMTPINTLAAGMLTPGAPASVTQLAPLNGQPPPTTPATGGVRLPGAATFETQKLPDKPAENTTQKP